MNNKKKILKGTLILTIAGAVTRLIGFYYRIFLSHQIGAEQLGIYQLIFPLLVLAFSFTSSGIQLVISRQVAAGACRSRASGSDGKEVLIAGLFLSMVLSAGVFFLMRRFAPFLAEHFLSEPRCAPLLRAAAWCVPLSGIHMCIEGYYFGRQKTAIPAATSLAEQLVRVLSVWLLCRIAVSEGRALTVEVAVYGMVLGEAASALICVTALSFGKKASLSALFGGCFRETAQAFVRQGIPLTANRVLLNLLQSLEAVLIPGRLRMFGLSASESLSVYGVLTGMALPFVLFPSTLINSASTMLMPSVADAQARHQEYSLKSTVEYTLKYCLLLGIFCTSVFVFWGHQIGLAVFHNQLAGRFLCVLGWICPLLYISSTFGSIIHGLGKTMTVFVINLCSLFLRILFVLILIPRYSILGYLWGMLACHLLSAFLYIVILKRSIAFSVNLTEYLIKPCLAALASCMAARLMIPAPKEPSIPVLGFLLALSGAVYLLFICFMGCLKEFRREH